MCEYFFKEKVNKYTSSISLLAPTCFLLFTRTSSLCNRLQHILYVQDIVLQCVMQFHESLCFMLKTIKSFVKMSCTSKFIVLRTWRDCVNMWMCERSTKEKGEVEMDFWRREFGYGCNWRLPVWENKSVSISTALRTGRPRVRVSDLGMDERYFISKASWRSLEPTQPPIQWLMWTRFPWFCGWGANSSPHLQIIQRLRTK